MKFILSDMSLTIPPFMLCTPTSSFELHPVQPVSIPFSKLLFCFLKISVGSKRAKCFETFDGGVEGGWRERELELENFSAQGL